MVTENKYKAGVKKGKTGTSLFSFFENRFKADNLFAEGFPVEWLPRIVFVMALSLFYIGNSHYAEKTVRRISQMQAEVEDLRADYTTLKSDLMFASKQSEVARKVKVMGLKESLTPPHKIVVEDGEY